MGDDRRHRNNYYGSSSYRPRQFDNFERPANGFSRAKPYHRRRSRSPSEFSDKAEYSRFGRDRAFDYERSPALNYDDPYARSYYPPAPPAPASREYRPAYRERERTPAPLPRPYNDYREPRLAPPFQEQVPERVLYEQGYAVDLPYDDEPPARPASPAHKPINTSYRSSTPSASSKLNSPVHSVYKSPAAPPTPSVPVPPVRPSHVEIEEGEDIDMADLLPDTKPTKEAEEPAPAPERHLDPPPLTNGIHPAPDLFKEEDGEEMQLDDVVVQRVQEAPPPDPEPVAGTALPALPEPLAETGQPTAPAEQRVADPVLDPALAEPEPIVPVDPPPQEPEPEIPRPKSPSPLPDSFDELLKKLASRTKFEDTIVSITEYAKNHLADFDAKSDRPPIADITNKCFYPCAATLKTHAEIGPFLNESFKSRRKALEDRSKELRHEYKVWNKAWKKHVKRMEKIRSKHAKRLTVPQHYGHVLQSHPHLSSSFSSSQNGFGPSTPGLDFGGQGYFEEYAGSPSIFGGTIATTPGGPLSGRPSRRSAPNAAMGFSGDAVRSEAEFLEILATLENADALDPASRAARSAAVIPDQMAKGDVERLILQFNNENHIVTDPTEHYGIGPAAAARSDPSIAEWTDEEVDVFCQRFALYPKQFGKIAMALPRKNLQQCVLFYYRLKDTMDFRVLTQRRTKGGPGRKPRAQANVNTGSSLIAAMKPSLVDEEEETEEAPPPSARRQSTSYSWERVMGPLLEDGVGYTATKRLLFGSNKRAESEAARLRRAQARQQAQEALHEIHETAHVPSDGTLTAAEALTALHGFVPPTPDGDQDADTRSLMERSIPVSAGGLQQSKRKANTSSYWSLAEKGEFTKLLALHGKDWNALSSVIGTKTAVQCRNFFANNKHKLDLESILARAEAGHTEENQATPQTAETPHEDSKEAPTSQPKKEPATQEKTATREPQQGFFQAPADSSRDETLSLVPDEQQSQRQPSSMKINDLLNAEEENGTPVTSMDHNWFSSIEAREVDDTDGQDIDPDGNDMTDEEPDLPRRHVDARERYYPQQDYYRSRYGYDESVPMHRYPISPYDPYRRDMAWQQPPPASQFAPMPPRGYDDRYYGRDVPPAFSPYGVQPRSHLYDPRSR